MMKKLATLTVLASFAGFAGAVPTTISDTTNGGAVNDGVVNGGEYVGFSSGINGGFGDVMGAVSQLHVDSDLAGNLFFGLIEGAVAGLNDTGVIYIDSVAGGFSDTTTLGDAQDDLRKAISGWDGTTAADMTFATGFQADYAIAFDNGFAGLWQLAAGGDGSLAFVSSANLMVGVNQYEMDITLANIGIGPGGSFDYVTTYLNENGGPFRSDEFHGVAAFAGGNPGSSAVVLSAGDFNTFNAVPEPGSLALIGLGLLGIGAARRRRS